MEVVSHWHTQRRASAPGDSGRRVEEPGSRRETPKCACDRASEKERETLFSPFISVSQWDQGAAVERRRVKRTGLRSGACVCTHLSSAGKQGDAQASSFPSLPEMHVAY